MKNIFILVFLAGVTTSLFSQVPLNRTVFDCSNNSKNIYATLATGKSIIVLHKGVDCSICRSAAPGWQTWAAANTTNVEVWGALTYTYSGSAFPVSNMCTLTTNWVSRYGWNDIFTFPDSNRLWVQAASPRYYVYSAIDSSIAYQGPNSTTARNVALAQSAVGLNGTILNDAKVYATNGRLIIKDLPKEINSFTIRNVKGQVIKINRSVSPNFEMDVSIFPKGIYFIQFVSERGYESRKLIF
jgi:hypothetical protein